MILLNNIKNYIKRNYEFLFSIILLILILVVAINPSPYISASLKGFTVWAKIVLPSLFCFFILTKLLMQNKASLKLFNFLNKPFSKLYNTKNVGGYIFIMSAISGYPIGAKLISEFYANNTISKDEAHRLTSYCSTSGPMFILGSIASSLFKNYKLGIILILSHFLSALINGFIYRKYKLKFNADNKKNINTNEININNKKQTLNDIMYNTIISVLMVGGFIALCFTFLEVLINTGVLSPAINFINTLLPKNIKFAEGIIKGIVEVTNGCVYFNTHSYPIFAITIVLSGLISFGGISIHMQSHMYLSKCGIKYKYFLFTKITHSIISIMLSIIFSLILL